MLLFIFIGLMVLAFISVIVFEKGIIDYSRYEAIITFWMFIVGFVGLILSVAFCTMPYSLEDMQHNYEKLKYQYSTEYYDNASAEIKYEIISDINEYNNQVRYAEENYDNFLIGIFIPDEYKELDYIFMDKG